MMLEELFCNICLPAGDMCGWSLLDLKMGKHACLMNNRIDYAACIIGDIFQGWYFSVFMGAGGEESIQEV